ncbi:MAG: carboxylesterase family protein [Gammaproteobacteria bacterium]|nr:carboxylesterase family protein [Gammaproteobacteria bacterium]
MAFGAQSAFSAEGDLVVATKLGPVRGWTRGGIREFPGIPCGAPNVGIHRFVAPRPVASWTEVLDLDPASARTENDQGSDAVRFDGPLRVDVFAPVSVGSLLPVLVTAKDWDYPSPPTRQPPGPDSTTVLVRIGHRRGAFGFTYLGGLLEREFLGSGNAGLLDIVHALGWVRDNIAAFGGNPGDVTLTGGDSVGCVAVLPAARGLFRSAATTALPRIATPEAADRATGALLTVLGIARAKARSLQQVSAAELQSASAEVRAALPPDAAFGPVADDIILPRVAIPAAQLTG